MRTGARRYPHQGFSKGSLYPWFRIRECQRISVGTSLEWEFNRFAKREMLHSCSDHPAGRVILSGPSEWHIPRAVPSGENLDLGLGLVWP